MFPANTFVNRYKYFLGILTIIFLVALMHAHKNYNILSFYNLSASSSSDAPVSEIEPSVLKLYQTQANERKEFLKSVPDQQNYAILYNTLVPEVFCKDLVRIGYIGDGGKWICNPSKVENLKECVVYSLGTNNEPSFEELFQNFTNHKCILRSLDKDAQNDGTMKRITAANGIFMKALITSKTNKAKSEYSLKDVLSTFNDNRIDILKIDIEGAEFLIQDELISVPICQILIEIHGSSAKKTLELLQKFSKNGFYLFSYEINGAWHQLSEYSLIHRDCFKDYGVNTIYGQYLS